LIPAAEIQPKLLILITYPDAAKAPDSSPAIFDEEAHKR
jgi:hypothetical protein